MIPIILPKRRTKVRTGQVFNKLIAYVEGVAEHGKLQAVSQTQKFDNILNYTTNRQDKRSSQDKCIAVRCHGVTDLSSAAIEMNAVAARNTRCEDPAFHFVLAWPECEKPPPEDIFEAAEHAIRSLGLGEHQSVLAIHVNTDNVHCHAAVNRIHPDTFKSRNIEWAHKTIHLAARQSEIKHGWSHESGLYIVESNGQNNKSIILNPDHDHANRRPHCDEEPKILPTWHDPDSLDSWLKSDVTKALKHALPTLTNWYALHAWLASHGITLTDSGGGGMRLHATSHVTGEVIDLAAGKGLRILKRSELEKRWGIFTNGQPVTSIAPDPSHLSHGSVKDEMIRSPKASVDMEEEGTVRQGSLTGNNSKREARRDQRAAARADLRRRFSQYRRFVSESDVDYFTRTKEIRSERSQSLKRIEEDAKAVRLASRLTWPITIKGGLLRMAAIHLEVSRRRLEAEALSQTKRQSLRAIRLPPLVWREWLYEQANLGDQAALSALRGIVYQAQRDAKRSNKNALVPVTEAGSYDYRELQFHKAMARLIEGERKEVAIRPARSDAMRPYEADALLVKHIGMQRHVTGNGNIAYSDQNGGHLFTDRGNRVTFDRVLVSDDDIRLALIHAQQKFGNQLTLTGDDPVFTARMACLADDMGITILNPDMRQAIANHRNERLMKSAEAQNALSASTEITPSEEAVVPSDSPVQQEDLLQKTEQTGQFDLSANHERLRVLVLAIDPRAEFVIPDISLNHTIYSGPVAATFTSRDSAQGFAQHLGRGVYVLHPANAPAHHNNASIEIQYCDGLAVATVPAVGKGTNGKAR